MAGILVELFDPAARREFPGGGVSDGLLPDLTENMAPNQPRDSHGRWTKFGGGGKGSHLAPNVGDLTFVKELPGSTKPGQYQDVHGTKYVVKKGGHKKAHLENEELANDLYRVLNLPVPASAVQVHDGETVKVSKWIDDSQTLSEWRVGKSKTEIDAMHAKIAEGYVADALLANWDVVGMHADNIKIKDGVPYRIDNGGALKYRAQGEPKGALFGGEVTELKSLKSHPKNPEAVAVFGHLTHAEIVQQAKEVLAKKDQLLAVAAKDPETHAILSKRLDFLAGYAGVTPGEHPTVASPPPPPPLPKPKVVLPPVTTPQPTHTAASATHLHTGKGVTDYIHANKGATPFSPLYTDKLQYLNPEGVKNGVFFIPTFPKGEKSSLEKVATLEKILPPGTIIKQKGVTAAQLAAKGFGTSEKVKAIAGGMAPAPASPPPPPAPKAPQPKTLSASAQKVVDDIKAGKNVYYPVKGDAHYHAIKELEAQGLVSYDPVTGYKLKDGSQLPQTQLPAVPLPAPKPQKPKKLSPTIQKAADYVATLGTGTPITGFYSHKYGLGVKGKVGMKKMLEKLHAAGKVVKVEQEWGDPVYYTPGGGHTNVPPAPTQPAVKVVKATVPLAAEPSVVYHGHSFTPAADYHPSAGEFVTSQPIASNSSVKLESGKSFVDLTAHSAWKGTLTSAETMAIHSWKGSSGKIRKKMHEQARAGQGITGEAGAILSAMEKHPPVPGVFYRGIHGTYAQNVAESAKQMVGKPDAFVLDEVAHGLSVNVSTAAGFASGTTFIRLKTKSTRPIWKVNGFDGEAEVLQPPMTKYRVVAVHENVTVNGYHQKYVVDLEEI